MRMFNKAKNSPKTGAKRTHSGEGIIEDLERQTEEHVSTILKTLKENPKRFKDICTNSNGEDVSRIIGTNESILSGLIHLGFDPLKSGYFARVAQQFHLGGGKHSFMLNRGTRYSDRFVDILLDSLYYDEQLVGEDSPYLYALGSGKMSERLRKRLKDLGYRVEDCPDAVLRCLSDEFHGQVMGLVLQSEQVTFDEKGFEHIARLILARSVVPRALRAMLFRSLVAMKDRSDFQEEMSMLLFASVAQGDEELVSDLLRLGTDPDLYRTEGVTALMLASEKGLPSLVELLVANGADPSLKDDKGKTAIEHNPHYAHYRVYSMLDGITTRD